ncbi:MAG TPA: CHAT domain-containing protein [Candidatus Angelobacter sp.]|nr:CHAT domain-containing protein [Candidatus Angelobacter sp.]
MLQRQWQQRWDWDQRRRGQAYTTLTTIIVVLGLLLGTGCRQKPQPTDWGKFYAEARLKKEIHDKSAAEMAERGIRETERLDALLHYKFILLKAGIAACTTPKEVLAMLAQAPPGFTQHPDLEAERRYTQAFATGCTGDYASSEQLLRDAEALAEQASPPFRANIASLRAWLDGKQKRPAQQEKNYLTAVTLARQFNNPVEASALNNLGLLYYDSKRYRDALEKLTYSAEVARKWQDRWVEEHALGNLGFFYSELGDYPNGEEYSKRAADIAHAIGEPADEKAWLITLGRSYQADARQLYAEAQEAYARAIQIARELHDQQAEAKCYHNLAQLAFKQSDIAQAKKYTEQAAELHPEGDLGIFLLLDQAYLALAQKDFPEAERLLTNAIRNPSTAPFYLRSHLQADLGRTYEAEKRDELAEHWFRNAIETAENALAEISDDDERITLSGSGPFYASYISFLTDRKRYREALAVAELGRSRTLAETSGKRTEARALADIARIQRRLKPQKEVVLAYFVADDRSYLWAITHEQLQFFPLPPIKELYEKIHAYNKEIQDLGKLGDSSLGSSLYEILVRPAGKLIPRDALVTVVPNRYLYHLDFDALVAPGPPAHYWIEDVDIQIASALTLLANSHPRTAPPPKQILLMGAAIQAQDGPRALQYADAEIRAVANHFPAEQRVVINREQAIPKAYVNSSPERFRYIHFAAHGVASQNKPLESAILLSPDAAGQYKLSAPEIIKSKIHADLVTISSCESAGLRSYDTEGLVGLGWAFMRAGAHSVVAGLWDVDDASTPGLMDTFYAELQKGQRPAHALRLAKLAMLGSGDHNRRPYYWSALQLYTGP